MDRAEATGFGVAVAGHGALLAALAFGLATAANPPLLSDAIQVSFVEEIGLVSAAPVPNLDPPAQSMAPEVGPPEELAPVPEPAPPEPAPAPKQAEPTPAREKAPPQPARERPAPKAKAKAEERRARGSRLGPDFLKGIGRDPSPSRETRPTGAVMSQQAAADIGSAILRQVQPCADQQVNPAPGVANRIVTEINLRLNRNGSLAAPPRVVRQTGLDGESRRYADRVADLAIATFVGCAPLRGLPQELYDVPNGWRDFTLRYRLPE